MKRKCHTLHKYSYTTAGVLLCTTKCDFCIKGQTLQKHSFSPVCVCIHTLKCEFTKETQTSQYGFSQSKKQWIKYGFHEKFTMTWFFFSMCWHVVPEIVFLKLNYQTVYIHMFHRKFLFLCSFPHFLFHITKA